MNIIKQNKYLILILLVVGAIILIPKNPVKEAVVGSVSQSNDYQASSTKNFRGTSMPNLTVLNANPGALGSVVITGAGAGVINLFDATSTVTNSEWPTTTLVTIPASAVAGTYTFDIAYRKGLLVEIIGTTPTSTITFR